MYLIAVRDLRLETIGMESNGAKLCDCSGKSLSLRFYNSFDGIACVHTDKDVHIYFDYVLDLNLEIIDCCPQDQMCDDYFVNVEDSLYEPGADGDDQSSDNTNDSYCLKVISFQLALMMKDIVVGRTFKNKQTSRKWVACKLADTMRMHLTIIYIEAFEYLKRDFGVHINDIKILTTLKEARTMSKPQFCRAYDCLDACKKDFKASCRPLISLDGYF
ncbi:hypothetical protein CR513_39053, partial [Mucuna pruriens]